MITTAGQEHSQKLKFVGMVKKQNKTTKQIFKIYTCPESKANYHGYRTSFVSCNMTGIELK